MHDFVIINAKTIDQAWVTLATNDSYGLGALVLAHSLRRVGSTFPAVVLITPSVTEAMRERLRAVFAEVVLVDVLDSGDAAHLALLQRPELGITFTKIHCWNLTQYEKCVFLDADTLVIQNCDELFEREELSAAPDVGWPDCFNSGVFVFKPSAETFSNLITFATERGSFDGGDQGLLNSYFSDWAHGDINKHLPFLYNVTSAAFYSYLPALKQFGENLKIIHFIGAIKPWLQQYNWESRTVEAPEHLRNFLQLWWDLFVADVHTKLDTTMDYIEEDPSPVLLHENPEYREPVFHSAYYEPILDPNSEFPWHHPDNQIPDNELNEPEIDMSQFHDPWDIYRGIIPPSTEQSAPEKQNIDQDMRKHAWDYMPPQPTKYQTDRSHTFEQPSFINFSHLDNQNNSIYHSIQTTHHQSTHVCNQNEHTETIHHTSDTYNQNEQTKTMHHTAYTPNNDSEHTKRQIDSSSYYSEPHNIEHYSEHYYDHSHKHNQEFNYNDNQVHSQHDSSEQQISVSNNREPHNYHEHHYNYTDRSQDDNRFLNIQNSESQITNHVSSTHKNHGELDVAVKHKNRGSPTYWQSLIQNTTKHVYTVMMDHVRMKYQQISEVKVNGHDSDSDSDVYEDITPRHPYDGFYLRHRMTIDSHGRKICTHEIPLIPRSPTPSSDEYEDALEKGFEDINDETVINEDIQTGVAGNLALVVPGVPLQREAIDELTRRQGWETGNIDYMGADSFDNIWSKISQTLSQPPASQMEQSSESQSEPAPQQICEPVAVETKMDVVEAVAGKQPVLTTAEKEEFEVPKSAELETSEPAVTIPVEVSTPKEQEKAEVPVPVSETEEVSSKIEEPIPIPAEIAAEISATVDVVVPVETSSPSVDKDKPVQAEIPIAALEALKVDEPLAEIPVPAPVVEQPPVAVSESEPVAHVPPTPATEPKPVVEASVAPETPEKSATNLEVGSDSPPLVHTPSKDDVPVAPAAKSEERRKPVGKLQLRPPALADPLPTPDSELEDAAALAHAIITSELHTPTITASTPPTSTPTPASATDPVPAQLSRLSVQEPEVPSPPVGSVSLTQIGVKPKPSTAALIESSVTTKTEPSSKTPEATEAPKKKVVKKVIKKEKEGASSTEAPVPPPRKKEKKPKDK
ncbi:unnamed protein product [Euphydryas editha]|uniref:glycogenin glucosyltransferase n=1 Tax=Euphydryas editha TaxID=104508 RepID=A0AAU9UUQ2_EUPED|nr:unnamed protein product [Euphydryas editha]